MAWVAGQQLALITSQQLHSAGVGPDAIRVRAARGRLHRMHRGVYLVGHPIPLPGAREFAALLACGQDAVVSHRSAAGLWEIASARDREVEVTVARRNCRGRDGIRVHRVAELDHQDRRTKRGIAVTSPARTLLDYAATASEDELERAVAQAYALGLVREPQIKAALARGPHRRGSGRLRAAIQDGHRPAHTRSELERRMLRLLRAARLALPSANLPLAGFEVDFLWPAQRLVVEVDGYRFHGHRAAFERDRRKDLALAGAGYRVIRITWRQLVDEPFAVVATIARILGQAGHAEWPQH